MSSKPVIEEGDFLTWDNPSFPPNGMRFTHVAMGHGWGGEPASDRPRMTWYLGPGDAEYRPLKDGEELPPNPFTSNP